MTKVINIPDFQIDDVHWTRTHANAFYSAPGDTEPGEHQFIDIEIDKLEEWLEENGHLIIEMRHLTSDGLESETYPSSLDMQDFRLLDNSHTWPIIRQYLLEFHMPVPQLDGIAFAISNICSHFNKAL